MPPFSRLRFRLLPLLLHFRDLSIIYDGSYGHRDGGNEGKCRTWDDLRETHPSPPLPPPLPLLHVA